MWRPSLGCANLRKLPPLVAFLTTATLFCVAADGAQTHVIEENGVRLEYASIVPPADVIFALGQAVYARTVVPRFLHRAPPHVLRVMLVDAERIPFTDATNTIWVPYGRLKARRPGTDPLSLVHETTHVVASGPGDQDRTLTEGLAVYVQDAIGPEGYPNFGVDLHRATLDLQAKVGRAVPLLESERVRHASEQGDERMLAYTQEGSFARWLIETNGLHKFFELMQGADPTKIYGRDWSRLESEWRGMINSLTATRVSDR
jgi:hypothetical protein